MSRLQAAFEDTGLGDKCDVRELQTLHTKGILSDHALLLGSMNLTESGVHLNDEQISIEFGATKLAEARVNFVNYFPNASYG